MRKQIERISIHQTSKVIALIAFVFSALYAIPASIFMYYMSGGDTSFFAFLLFPVFMFIISYIMYVILFFVYNIIASSFGGIEVTFKDVE